MKIQRGLGLALAIATCVAPLVVGIADAGASLGTVTKSYSEVSGAPVPYDYVPECPVRPFGRLCFDIPFEAKKALVTINDAVSRHTGAWLDSYDDLGVLRESTPFCGGTSEPMIRLWLSPPGILYRVARIDVRFMTPGEAAVLPLETPCGSAPPTHGAVTVTTWS